MSETSTPNEEQTTDSGGENTENVETTSEKDVVPKAELQKVINDMMKYKKLAKELEVKTKEQEMQKLRDQQEWQKIAEIKEKEALEAKQEASSLKDSFLNSRKYEALKNAALTNGIRKEALNDLELLNFDDYVAIETTSTGKINVIGVDQAVKNLKAQRPHWFGKSTGHVNTDNPEEVPGAAVTMNKVIEAQNKARKSGDWSEYKKLLGQYQSQKR